MIIIIFLAWNQTLALKNGRNLWAPHSPGVWTPWSKKGMDMLIPFILHFSNIFDSDPQEIHFASKSSTHMHTHKGEKNFYHYYIWSVRIFSILSCPITFFKMLCLYDQIDFMTTNGSWTTIWYLLHQAISNILWHSEEFIREEWSDLEDCSPEHQVKGLLTLAQNQTWQCTLLILIYFWDPKGLESFWILLQKKHNC